MLRVPHLALDVLEQLCVVELAEVSSPVDALPPHQSAHSRCLGARPLASPGDRTIHQGAVGADRQSHGAGKSDRAKANRQRATNTSAQRECHDHSIKSSADKRAGANVRSNSRTPRRERHGLRSRSLFGSSAHHFTPSHSRGMAV